MNEHIIELEDIGKVYSTEEMDTHALQHINLSIRDGDYISISGPSGCGKSTLLSILGMLDTPSSGRYLIQGTDTSGLNFNQRAELRNQHIGFIFQSFNLIDEIDVFNNVALPLTYRRPRLSQQEVKERVMQSLEAVQMSHRVHHKPNQLSGGQQQRIAIARALVGKPTILLVDEPTGNLDSKNGDAVMEQLDQLNNDGTTICMVTHDPRYANHAERQLHLLDGRLLDDLTNEQAV